MWGSRFFLKAAVARCAGLVQYPASAHDIWQLDDLEYLRYTSAEIKLRHLAFRAFLRQNFSAEQKTYEERPRVYISYPWAVHGLPDYRQDKKNARVVECIASDLKAAQFQVHLDVWEDKLQHGLSQFLENMPESDHILMFGTPLYLLKYNKKVVDEDEAEHVVRFEVEHIIDVMRYNRHTAERVVPIVLSGTVRTSMPPLLRSKTKLHLTEENDYHEKMLHLVCDLHHVPYAERQRFDREMKQILKDVDVPGDEAVDLSVILEDEPGADSSFTTRKRTVGHHFQVEHNLPPRDGYFTGREALLTDLDRALHDNSRGIGVVTQAISGAGGVGKTTFALEYAHRQITRRGCTYEVVRWLRMETEESQKQAWSDFARDLGVELEGCSDEEAIKKVFSQLGSRPYLLIFDNVRDYESVRAFLPSSSGIDQHILITSRSQQVWDKPVCIDLFTDREALDYVHKQLASFGRKAEETDEKILELARALGYLPLALNLAVRYIREPQISIDDFLRQLDEKGSIVLGKRPQPCQGQADNPSFNALCRLTMERLKRHSEGAWRLLTFTSLLSPEQIPRTVLRRLCDDDEQLAEYLASLFMESLLKSDYHKNGRLSIHRLLQGTLSWNELGVNRLRGEWEVLENRGQALLWDWVKPLVEVLSHSFPTKPSSRPDYELIDDLLIHYQTMVVLLESLDRLEWPLASEKLLGRLRGDIVYWQGRGCRERHDYTKAVELLIQALPLRERAYGQESAEVASTCHELGKTHHHRGDYRKAIEAYGLALEVWRQVYRGLGHRDIAATLHNMGGAYSDLGQYELALQHYEEALEIKRRLRNESPLFVATTLHNIGLIYKLLGQYSKAQEIYEEVLEIKKKQCGDSHPSYAATLNNMAQVYGALGHYDQALENYEKALDIYSKLGVRGDVHPEVANTLDYMSLVYNDRGGNSDYEEALDKSQQACEIKTRIYGDEHPSTAAALSNLALTHRNMGDYGRSLGAYKNALSVMDKKCGSQHPNTIVLRLNMGIVYNLQENYGKALPIFRGIEEGLRDAYGEKHPLLAELWSSMAVALAGQGHETQAHHYITEAEAVMEKYPDSCPAKQRVRRLAEQLESKVADRQSGPTC